MHQCLHEDHFSTSAERDNQETELVSELHTRLKSTPVIRMFCLLKIIICCSSANNNMFASYNKNVFSFLIKIKWFSFFNNNTGCFVG